MMGSNFQKEGLTCSCKQGKGSDCQEQKGNFSNSIEGTGTFGRSRNVDKGVGKEIGKHGVDQTIANPSQDSQTEECRGFWTTAPHKTERFADAGSGVLFLGLFDRVGRTWPAHGQLVVGGSGSSGRGSNREVSISLILQRKKNGGQQNLSLAVAVKYDRIECVLVGYWLLFRCRREKAADTKYECVDSG